jgi:hypothetical protein
MTDTVGGTGRQRNAEARVWFGSQQQKMIAELREVRAVHDHPTAKGDGTELHWLELLQNRLPARYRAERAFVVDAYGDRSEQIDIVIHDRQFCPMLLDTAGGLHIPAESVYAVLEVKQDLSKKQIAYAGEKIRSVRRLHRTSAEFPHASGRNRRCRFFTDLLLPSPFASASASSDSSGNRLSRIQPAAGCRPR